MKKKTFLALILFALIYNIIYGAISFYLFRWNGMFLALIMTILSCIIGLALREEKIK